MQTISGNPWSVRPVSDAIRPGVQDDPKAALNAALSRLPAEQREAIELAAGARMTYQQIAERTGVPGITVQRRINRGLLALRVALRDQPYFDSLSYPESDRS
jgi:DNA-directed RNA polymerase specialized sigma24 family protein